MGLDIIVYALGEFVTSDSDYDYDYPNETHIYVNPSFTKQADGLVSGVYKANELTGFRAGSYSGYNKFRSNVIEKLYHVSDKEYWEDSKYENEPLRDWLHFSDCEGILGPKTCIKLYKECLEVNTFIKWDDEWDIERWEQWMNAFKVAAENNGVVAFH